MPNMACYFPEIQEESNVDWLNQMTSAFVYYIRYDVITKP